jgi:hypothetical protein
MTSFNRASAVALVLIAHSWTTPVQAADVGAGFTNAVAADSHARITLSLPPYAATSAERNELTGAKAARWEFAQRSTVTKLRKCESKKKGTLIGAAVGGVAGAAFALYVIGEVGGVLGTGNGSKAYLFYWTAGGAGGGALAGFAYCR